MRTGSFHRAPPDTRDAAIRILIAYDTIQTGKRAEAIYERLLERLGNNFEFEQQLWRFDLLGDPLLRELAAQDAAQADIVIIATDNDSDLPIAVQQWLESALKQHVGAAALVALTRHHQPPVQPYLEDIARRGGMDFFAQAADATNGSSLSLPLLSSIPQGRARWLTNN